MCTYYLKKNLFDKSLWPKVMSQEFEFLKLTMDGLFVSHALIKSQGINRFALMASEEKSCTPTPWLTLLLVLGKSHVNQKSR